MRRTRLSILLSLLATAACRTQHSTAPESLEPQTRAEVGATPPSAPSGTAGRMIGSLSEEEFKALHAAPTNVAPPRHGKTIEIAGARAYLSLPPNASAPIPGIVVVHEWWGLNANIEHWADRLAAEGFAAIAVDLYGGVVTTSPDEAMAAMKKVEQPRATEILLAAHEFLRNDPRIRARKRASIGWCFGGSQSLALALAAPDLDAAVMYYGFPVTDPNELAPMKADLLAIFGSRDKNIPPEKVEEFRAALTKAGKKFTIQSYDAEHAFANPSNARYDEGAAAEAWKLTAEFLHRELGR